MLLKDTAAAASLSFYSGVYIDAQNCKVDVASKIDGAAFFNGVSSIKGTVCTEAAVATIVGPPPTVLRTNCRTAPDPFAGTLPTVSNQACAYNSQSFSGNVTLNPGVYCGNFSFASSGTNSLTLNAGLYIFKNAQWDLFTTFPGQLEHNRVQRYVLFSPTAIRIFRRGRELHSRSARRQAELMLIF